MMLSDHGMVSSHRHIISVQGKEVKTSLVGPGDMFGFDDRERYILPSRPVLPESMQRPFDVCDPLHILINRIRFWQCQTWTTDDPKEYEHIAERLGGLLKKLRAEVTALRVPRRNKKNRPFSKTQTVCTPSPNGTLFGCCCTKTSWRCVERSAEIPISFRSYIGATAT
jgi:hypothetical protein